MSQCKFPAKYGILTRLLAGINHGLIPSSSKRIFSSPECRLALGPTKPPVQWVLEAKWLGNETKCLPPASDKIHEQ
jgi:hypothetical protein